MQKVANFEKVSFDNFAAAMRDELKPYLTQPAMYDIYNAIELPKRATSGSAGYDFRTPIEFTLAPGESIKIPTGIRVRIDEGWWLGCLPRSGLGFKYQVTLANTLGVIDSDYYYSSNEGHIFLKVVNRGEKILTVQRGDAFAQGIFIPYGVTYDDNASTLRDGGIGSTGS